MKYDVHLKPEDITALLNITGELKTNRVADAHLFHPSLTVHFHGINVPTARIHFHTNQYKIDIDYKVEGGALMNTAFFTDFRVQAQLKGGTGDNPEGFRLVSTKGLPPKIVKWMNDSTLTLVRGDAHTPTKATNLDFLCFCYYVAGMCINRYPFAMDGKYSADGETCILTPKPNYIEIIRKDFWKWYRRERLKHLYDGWDTITLNMTQLAQMGKYVEGVKLEDDEVRCPLDRFCFRCIEDNGNVMAYFYEVKRGNAVDVTVNCEDAGDRVAEEFTFTASVGKTTGDIKILKTPKEKKWQEFLTDKTGSPSGATNLMWIMSAFFCISVFMLYFKNEAIAVEERVCKEPSGSGKRNYSRSERTTVRLMKSYTLKKNWEHKVERKKMEITCPAWGVKGHYRRSKTGKLVFVHPYVKGRERDKYVGKDYVL